VAGESPGKSDQQKSSGETARGARDPRLTAFREGEADGVRSAVAVAEDASESAPEGSSAASAEPESERPEAAGDDGASGVRESEDSESVEAEAAPEAESGDSEADPPEGGDSRLREAVAAWVASDEPDAGDGKPSDEPVDQGTTSPRATDTPSGAEGDADASGSEGSAKPGSDDGADGDDKAASGGKGSGTSRTAKAGSDAEGASGAKGDGDDKAVSGGEGSGKSRTAKAGSDAEFGAGASRTKDGDAEQAGSGGEGSAKTGSGDEADADGGDDKAVSGGEGSGKSRTAKAGSDAEGVSGASGSGGSAKAGSGASGAKGDGDDKAVSGGEGSGKSRTAKAGSDAEGGVGASRTKGDDAEKAASGVKGDAGASGGRDSAAAGSRGEGDGDSGGTASERSVDQKTAVFRTPKSAADSKGAKADADASGGRRPAWAGSDDDGDDKGDKAASGDEEDKPSGRPSIDQKTAVFRAPKVDDKGGKPLDRPTAAFGVLPEKKKGVDQPTTAIKALSGDEAKSGKSGKSGKDGKGAKDDKRSEGENERTSKFVPLRSTDAPAPAKAPEKAAKPDTAPAKPADLPETERTRQQPLPPQTPDGKQPAPLDLLAQLTNKPPKPETPVRTAVRRVKIWTPLAILLVVLLGVAQAVRPLPEPELKLTGDESYAFKGEKLAMPWSGEGQSAAEVQGVGSLGTSGAQKPVPIASVTKVMTAYVVLKSHPLKAGAEGPRIKIDATAAQESGSADESRASVKEGQSFTQHQLLQLLLINSSNNIARLLARWDAGSLDAFTKKMNDAAKSLGMKNSTYTDPSGLKESTKSTAADQLKLAKAAMESDAFREVVATPNTEIPGLDGKIYNNNNLLVKPGVIGIKTGSSTPAGGALMWGAVRTIEGKKQRILGVVLEQRAPTTLDASLQLAQTESYKLITAAQDALTSATVIKKGDVVGQVDDGLGGTTPVVATKDLKAVGWAGLDVDIKIGDGGKTIPHSAKAGTVVGEVTVGTGPGQVKAPVALQNDLSEPSFGSKLIRVS